ncbi:MAG: ABATE domain-containing protein [Acidobacteriia bacterium]|nr:ABATE domain-containing protein [Terriglobia bacterium]
MPDFIFNAGHLALDLVNTEQVAEGVPVDLLDSPAALLEWLRQSGAVAPSDMKAAEKAFLRDKAASGLLLQQARSLRSALRHMAEAISGGRPVSAQILAAINAVLRQSPRVLEIMRQKGGYALQWRPQNADGEALLAPVAEAAARLLAEGDHSRVRKCANPTCVLYVYDTTRSRTRHWCSMQSCGNRAKAARFYGKHHGR